jgi:hypothetical protein
VKESSSAKDKSTSSGKEKVSSEKEKSSSEKKSSTSSSGKKEDVHGPGAISTEDKYITITPGDSSTTVASKLKEAGIISDAAAFDRFLCNAGYDRRITTGKKMIPAGASDVEIAGIITVR